MNLKNNHLQKNNAANEKANKIASANIKAQKERNFKINEPSVKTNEKKVKELQKQNEKVSKSLKAAKTEARAKKQKKAHQGEELKGKEQVQKKNNIFAASNEDRWEERR